MTSDMSLPEPTNLPALSASDRSHPRGTRHLGGSCATESPQGYALGSRCLQAERPRPNGTPGPFLLESRGPPGPLSLAAEAEVRAKGCAGFVTPPAEDATLEFVGISPFSPCWAARKSSASERQSSTGPVVNKAFA